MESPIVYIPIDRRHALAAGKTLPDRAEGSALFADISGFVPLTEELTRALGPERGVEELVAHLDQIYDALIAQVDRFGGSAIAFSGDAITCWFDADTGKRATAAALAIQAAMAQFARVSIPHSSPVSLSVKVAVVAGSVRRFLVGDPSIQNFDVLAGTTLDRLAAAEEAAGRGQVLLDEPTWQNLAADAQLGEWRVRDGVRFAVCESLTREIAPQPWAPLAPDALQEEQIRPWIFAPVYERWKQGQGKFVADLRPAVSLFLNFTGIDYDGDPDAGIKLDQFIRRVQHVLARYEGVLLELTFGDKGSYLYAAFGAPIAHEEDTLRAIAAAQELRLIPQELDFIRPVRIGISRGRMRAGAYGGSTRLTYGVQGDEANFAARLMQHAAPDQILVSERIVNAIGPRYAFLPLGTIQVKGKQNAFTIFQVSGKAEVEPPVRAQTEIVGRANERAQLGETLGALVAEKRSGVVALEGEAGMGKSRLVGYVHSQAQAFGITTLLGSGDAVEKTTPYFAWQSVFAQLFNINALPDTAARRRHVLSELEAWAPPELVRLTPLLNAVLPLDFPENELTMQLSGQVRAENTYLLLTRVLQHRAGAGPLVVILEDAHWLDSASWILCRRVAQLHSVLQVIATRPFADGGAAEYHSLLQAAGTQRIVLTGLTTTDISTMVAQNLGANMLPEAVTQLIADKAEGNPFFSIELGYALRDAGLIVVEDGTCRIAPNVDLKAAVVPDTVQEVITSRIDRLTYAQQLTIKVASVIGRVFGYSILHDTFPVETDRPLLQDELQQLTRLDLTALEHTTPDIEYIFRHIIIQEVSYSLLLFAQRRELHRVIAEWYEHTHSADLAHYYGLLAYHWKKAEVPAKALDYLEQAGVQALRNFANAEAVSFMEQALALAAETGTNVQPERRALWELQAGEAHANLSHYVEARSHIERGFALLGAPVPTGRPGQVRALLAELFRQVQHRLFPAHYLGLRVNQREQFLPASLGYERLGEAAYFTGQPLISMYSAFRNLNQAEQVGPSPELGRGTAAVGALTGFIPLHRVAQSYLKRALGIAQITQHLESREFVLMSAAYYYSGVGDWAQVAACAAQLIKTAEELGDGRRWQDGVGIRMSERYFQGDFTASFQVADELYTHASRRHDLRYMARGLQGKAYSELNLGKTEQAFEYATELAHVLDDGQVQVLQLQMELAGLLAVTQLRLGQSPQAVYAAEQALALTTPARPTFYAAFMGYAAPGDVYLTLLEKGDRSAVNIERARVAIAALGNYARVFPIGQPRFHLQRGRHAWLLGNKSAAVREWKTSLEHAGQLGMVYDRGLAYLALAQHLAPGDAARVQALADANQTLTQVNAVYDLARVNSL